jgi:hypothetical protein
MGLAKVLAIAIVFLHYKTPLILPFLLYNLELES